ncbi:hypothetical protein AB0O67_29250 [Streptomyces sp. NPDC086077]|uniref:hypothetical protein n=1 Tax=Streptomyces sp. NPDC086077 TaxID=3154862 RepID=UPI0034438E2A
MIWHWIGLTVFSLTLLPAGIALLTGRVPQRLRARLTPMRPRGLACLVFYATAPLNAVPRLSDAPSSVIVAGTGLGMVAALAGCAAVIAAAQRPRAGLR